MSLVHERLGSIEPEHKAEPSTIGGLPSKTRLVGVDGLRAIAAVSVFVYHLDFFAPTSPDWARDLLQQLRFGVWVFFAISGFLLYRNWAHAHLDGSETPRLGVYFRNRLIRILPAYWVTLIFFTAIHNTQLDFNVGIAGVLRQFGLVQVYSQRDTVVAFGLPRGLPHAWSLAVELSFYLLLPLYGYLVGILGRWVGAMRAEFLALLGLGATWIVWSSRTEGNAFHQQWLPNFLMAFGVGIALAVLSTDAARTGERVRAISRFARDRGLLLWIVAALVLVLRSRLDIAYENGVASQSLYALSSLLLVAPIALRSEASQPTIVERVCDNAVARFLGRISYGIFLWHYLLIRVVSEEWLSSANGNVSFAKLAIVATPFVLIAATASWYIIEAPLLREARRERMRFHATLVLVTVGGLAWRVFYVMSMNGRDPQPKGDAAYYHYQALAIAKGVGFVDPFQWYNDGVVTPSAGHPPTYLLYLAGFTKMGANTWMAHRLASCILGALMVLFIGLAAREIAGDRAGIVAAVFGAGYANLFINDEMLMSESMAALAVAMVMWAVLRVWKIPSMRRCLELAAAIGFAALTRAELLTLALLFIVPLIAGRRDLPWRDRVLRIGASAVVVALMIAPWVGYNLSRFNNPVLMSNGIGGVALMGNCDATYDGPLLGYWYIGCGEKFAGDLAGDESDRELRWRTAGFDYLTDHLDRFPVVALARVGRMWDFYRPSQNTNFNGSLEGRGLGASQLAIRQYWPLLVLSVVGLALLRRRRILIWPFFVLAGLVTFTAITSFGITRYRIPVDVCLAILAAVPVARALEWFAGTARLRTS